MPIRASMLSLLPVVAGSVLGLRGAAAQPFPPVFELSGLYPTNGGDGSDGIVINGVAPFDGSGRSVASAGDINGDGVDDLLIGANGADPNGAYSGASYVIFGGASIGAAGVVELAALDGTNGFVINGVAAGHLSGASVSCAGDVNGDGMDDLIIGAYFASPNGSRSGQSYVVFGAPSVGSSGTIELSTLTGADGFAINGAAPGDASGFAVSSVGDVNGDGIDDVLIGADAAQPNGSYSGASYVVFGGSGVGSSGAVELSDLDGTNGFVMNGVTEGDHFGIAVSSAGDINGDLVNDLLIGATGVDSNGSLSGASYVVFGGAGVGSAGVINVSALDGSDGFVINGAAAGDRCGFSVSSAGDVNGDGMDDLLIGAYAADPNGDFSGASYVVFGGPGVGSTGVVEVTSLTGTSGFALTGGASFDMSGRSVSSSRDVNGDGISDLIIGAQGADPNGSRSGATYVVFGSATVGSAGVIELSALAGEIGFSIHGAAADDNSGHSVSSACDLNGDGMDDLVIGATGADPNGSLSGAAFVIFGRGQPCVADFDEPFGVLDFSDVIAFLAAFGASSQAADLALPFGVFDFSDVITFLAAFGAGCP